MVFAFSLSLCTVALAKMFYSTYGNAKNQGYRCQDNRYQENYPKLQREAENPRLINGWTLEQAMDEMLYGGSDQSFEKIAGSSFNTVSSNSTDSSTAFKEYNCGMDFHAGKNYSDDISSHRGINAARDLMFGDICNGAYYDLNQQSFINDTGELDCSLYNGDYLPELFGRMSLDSGGPTLGASNIGVQGNFLQKETALQSDPYAELGFCPRILQRPW